MGCGASKVDLDAYLVTQKPDGALIDGLVTLNRVQVTCSGGFTIAGAGFEPHPQKPMKIKFDGEARATVEKSKAGAFAVAKEAQEPGTMPSYSFIVKDIDGKMAAVCKKGAPRCAVTHSIPRYNPDWFSTVYCVKPRREGQASTFDADGTAMYEWAKIMYKDPSRSIYSSKRLAVYPVAADGVGYSKVAELVLSADWQMRYDRLKATTDYETTYDTAAGLAVIPHPFKLHVAGGVDPLLAVLALLEFSALKFEGPGLPGGGGGGGGM